jgi:uncharacterized protein (TIGR02594 family)
MFARIIDTAWNVTPYLDTLVANGVETVIRYYNRRNSSSLPEKRLRPEEARAAQDAGLALAVVFQQHARRLSDFSDAIGRDDAKRALDLTAETAQPAGSAIYFAVDTDFFRRAELDAVRAFFEGVRESFAAAAGGTGFRIGVYGSGTVAEALRDKGLVDLVWLAGATGWSGTRGALALGYFDLFQDRLDVREAGLSYDGNIAGPGVTDFGQFDRNGAVAERVRPGDAPAPVQLFEVNVRSKLNLRGAPDRRAPVLRQLPAGLRFYGLGRRGEWLRVDLEGDGRPDGYVHGDFAEPLIGAPARLRPEDGPRPVEIAYRELEKGVAEVPGPAAHPRISLYYSALGDTLEDDTTPWCSYFVNYCVSQTGREGTGKPNARSWLSWGDPVTGAPRFGDIVVFWRVDPASWQGHVGFFVGEEEDRILCLGGNQGDAVSIAPYARSRLLAYRRP